MLRRNITYAVNLELFNQKKIFDNVAHNILRANVFLKNRNIKI